jgi:hypothetical protein
VIQNYTQQDSESYSDDNCDDLNPKGKYASTCLLLLASSPGHSHDFNVTLRPPFLRVALKTWEWPGDEAMDTLAACEVYY